MPTARPKRASSIRILAASLAATAALLLVPSTAFACSCASTGSARDDARFILENSDAAFIGVLKSVREIDDGTPPGEPAPVGGEAVFRYRVRHDYGAPLARFVKVEAQTEGATCGLPRGRGKYALGINRSSGRWISGL